jgi:hypothetical protein
MFINDIWYEIFLHLDIDLQTCKLVCKTFKHIYDTYKATLCHYGNYRFNSFQLQFINDLNNYDNNNSLNIITMGNRGLRLAILAFAINYKDTVGIVTVERDLIKWQKELEHLTTDTNAIYVENFNIYGDNYKVYITPYKIVETNYMLIVHKHNMVQQYKNVIYCDAFTSIPRSIIYHNTYTYNNYNFYDSKNYKTIIDHIHYNQTGPFLIIGLKVGYLTYEGQKIRPNILHCITYKNFILHHYPYKQFNTIILVNPAELKMIDIINVYEKIKSLPNTRVFTIHSHASEAFIDRCINREYMDKAREYNLTIQNYTQTTKDFLLTIKKLLIKYGDDLQKIPNYYITFLIYCNTRDIKQVYQLIDYHIKQNNINRI